jgi:hypothetical protein
MMLVMKELEILHNSIHDIAHEVGVMLQNLFPCLQTRTSKARERVLPQLNNKYC